LNTVPPGDNFTHMLVSSPTTHRMATSSISQIGNLYSYDDIIYQVCV